MFVLNLLSDVLRGWPGCRDVWVYGRPVGLGVAGLYCAWSDRWVALQATGLILYCQLSVIVFGPG